MTTTSVEQPFAIERITLPLGQTRRISLSVARLDQLPAASNGNKGFKLINNVQAAKAQGVNRLVSFGGAYSNHLHAMAAKGREAGMETIGLVRLDEGAPLTPTLLDAVDWGMQLVRLSRSHYRQRHAPDFLSQLRHQFAPCWLIPEGGANAEGVAGCRALGRLLRSHDSFDVVACAVGTGTTLAGLVQGVGADAHVLGFPVLKPGQWLEPQVRRFIGMPQPHHATWRLDARFHFGRYAQVTPELVVFAKQVHEQTGLMLDAVYTAKALYGLVQSVQEVCFPQGSRLLFLHSGGLQGNRGIHDWDMTAA